MSHEKIREIQTVGITEEIEEYFTVTGTNDVRIQEVTSESRKISLRTSIDSCVKLDSILSEVPEDAERTFDSYVISQSLRKYILLFRNRALLY